MVVDVEEAPLRGCGGTCAARFDRARAPRPTGASAGCPRNVLVVAAAVVAGEKRRVRGRLCARNVARCVVLSRNAGNACGEGLRRRKRKRIKRTLCWWGNSQGGLIVQDLLHTVPAEDLPSIAGTVLMATGALGQPALVNLTASSVRASVVKQSGWLSYLRMVLTMKPPPNDVSALRAMFTLQDTASVSITGKSISMQEYLCLLRERPADGWPTYVSNVRKWGGREVPRTLGSSRKNLIIQFDNDQCYPEAHTTWLLEQYTGAELLRVPKQGHCGVDPGWESTLAQPLLDFIDDNN